METDLKPGQLYIVGTPIGNLEDITFRAIKILQTVDLIAAEDTRHTGRLLQHFQITTPQTSYHEHNRNSRTPELIQQLTEGKNIALVSDAGMPGISDPGYELVKACVEEGIKVVPIPGASAFVTALSASGLPTDRFVFEGFLPAKAKQRREHLDLLTEESRTLIFYESPHRLRDTLQDLASAFGNSRRIVLARELTKVYEEFWRGSIEEAIDLYSSRQPQGEYSILVTGAEFIKPQFTEAEIKTQLQNLINQGISRSQASREIAKITSLPRRQIYELALNIE
jgi:16S rRNA (cytidine1402-2'-O)-methyltransferase